MTAARRHGLLSVAVLLALPLHALAGGPLETVDITAAGPSPIPGHVLAKSSGSSGTRAACRSATR